MSLRKIAGLLMAGGLAIGLIGSGVGAAFTGSLSASESIAVGTFGCEISAYSAGTLSGDHMSLTYDASMIMSSTHSSRPLSFTVSSTGSIAVVVHLDVTLTQTAPPGTFSDMLGSVPDVTLTTASPTHEYAGGLSWGDLDNLSLEKGASVAYALSCSEVH